MKHSQKLLEKRVEKRVGISSISEAEIRESLGLIKRLKCTSLDIYPIYVQGALTLNPNTEGYTIE